MATKERSTRETGFPSWLRIRSDHFGSEATKKKQFSFADASHVRDCQSYRVKPIAFQKTQ